MVQSHDLLMCSLVLATVGFALHAARPPPSLGRVEATPACAIPVEIAGAGVVCLTAAEARAKKLSAGDRISRARFSSAGSSVGSTDGAQDRPGRMAADRLAAWRAPVDVNHATVEELASLDGIGEKLAVRIVAGRPFAAVEELARVKGIGVRRLARLRQRLILDE